MNNYLKKLRRKIFIVLLIIGIMVIGFRCYHQYQAFDNARMNASTLSMRINKFFKSDKSSDSVKLLSNNSTHCVLLPAYERPDIIYMTFPKKTARELIELSSNDNTAPALVLMNGNSIVAYAKVKQINANTFLSLLLVKANKDGYFDIKLEKRKASNGGAYIVWKTMDSEEIKDNNK